MSNKHNYRAYIFQWLFIFLIPAYLSGCLAAAVVGGSTAGASAANDERSLGSHLTDVVLNSAIIVRLAAEKDMPSRWVSVEVIKGFVWLTGYLSTQEQIDRAITIARSFSDVREVKSDIKLGSPSIRELSADSWITSEIKRKLLNDPVVSGFSIHVETVAGKVYLQGIVKEQMQRYRARDIASAVKGVHKVIDLMRSR